MRTIAADGTYGYPEWAPYDRIILTVSPWIIAPAWREQLKDGGRLVLPLDLGPLQMFVSFVRQGDELVSIEMGECAFMLSQGTFARPAIPLTQVGADPRLVLTSDKERPETADQVAHWLSEPQTDYPSGVTVSRQEIDTGLFCWWPDDLQDEELPGLMAQGDSADLEDLPAIYGWAGQPKIKFTVLALEFEGGKQERELANEYHKWAVVVRIKWPRTAHVLEMIAQTWEEHARREDIEAEQDKSQ